MNEIIDFLKAVITKITYVNGISVEDNLFHSGLDSLSAIMLTSEITKKYNLEIPISFLFTNTTIRQIANYIAEKKNEI